MKVDSPVGNGFFAGSIHAMTEVMGFLEPRIVNSNCLSGYSTGVWNSFSPLLLLNVSLAKTRTRKPFMIIIADMK